MKKCPACKFNTLSVVDSRSEVVNDVLRVVRTYQCINKKCSLQFVSVEKIENGEKKKIPGWMKRKGEFLVSNVKIK